MAIVSQLYSRWILDSRGLPTLYCQLILDQNGRKAVGEASVPSGASTGSHEALELRDGGPEFHGKGVDKAIHNVNKIIASKLVNREFTTALELDEFLLTLDESGNKSILGANATLAVSLASHRAFAHLFGLEVWQYLRRLYFSTLPSVVKFPRLMCNMINGGMHADNDLDVQEFLIIPNTREIENDIRLASEVYHTLKSNFQAEGFSTSVGDEGGFAPNLGTTENAFKYLTKAVNDAGYSSLDCNFGLDAAASEFYDKEKDIYHLDRRDFTRSQLADFYTVLSDEYNLLSLEDVFQEDDLIGWELITQKTGKKRVLVGDDLFVTNVDRFEEIGLKDNIANCVLIKPNQIGTIFETANMINKAKENSYSTAISHRSGETTDDFIVDLAFASQSEYLKIGAPARGERVAKYNRLLDIKDSVTS